MSTLLEKAHLEQAEDQCSVPPLKKKILRVFAAAAIAIAGILVVALLSRPASKDYISYWSAAQLLVHHANPYSPARVLALERTQGYIESKPLIMRNPPWALFLVAPLAFTNATAGLILWTLAGVGCVIAYLHLMNVPSNDRVLSFLFAPALGAIVSGQSSPFLLLGFCLFLRYHHERPFLAGASLVLMAIKPHLFLLFWALLLLDCAYQRRLRILAGGGAALTVATGFAMWLDPHIWRDYFAMLHASALDGEYFPTASMLFRLLINVKAYWLQLVPTAAGVGWGCWYYARHRHVWEWRIHGMLLMLVTVLVSPYGWFSDEIVLLPSLMFALSVRRKGRFSGGILFAMNSVALLLLIAAHATFNSGAYLWTPAGWLAWFLFTRNGNALNEGCAMRSFPTSPTNPEPAS